MRNGRYGKDEHSINIVPYLADEAIGMPMSSQCSDEIVLDGRITTMTFWSEETEEIFTTIRTTILR